MNFILLALLVLQFIHDFNLLFVSINLVYYKEASGKIIIGDNIKQNLYLSLLVSILY